jgi:hypothetical protein
MSDEKLHGYIEYSSHKLIDLLEVVSAKLISTSFNKQPHGLMFEPLFFLYQELKCS